MIDSDILSRYKRATSFEQMAFPVASTAKKLVLNDYVIPMWICGQNSFLYMREMVDGYEYRLVDAVKATNVLAFDHDAFAEALTKASGKTVSPKNLSIRGLSLDVDPFSAQFEAFEKQWSYDGTSCKECQLISADWIVSPDGLHAIFERDFDLWIVELQSGVERRLTTDGEDRLRYAAASVSWGYDMPGLQVMWSPDSKRILTTQRDTRGVRTMHRVDYSPLNGAREPAFLEYQGTWPTDEVIESHRVFVIDIETGSVQPAHYRAIPPCRSGTGLVNDRLCWWSASGEKAYFIDMERGQLTVHVVELDAITGMTRVLFTEESDTCIYLSTTEATPCYMQPIPETEELIWYSERSGNAHLYLYDLKDGSLKNVITSGDWIVREVLHLDNARRELFIQTGGRSADRDPYYLDLCRVNIDTGELTTIISTDHEYTVLGKTNLIGWCCSALWGIDESLCGVAPSSEFLVVTRSRVDEASVSFLLDRDGNVILELEECDTSGLPSDWSWPEPVKMLAADGKTDIYGVIYRPTNFSEDKKYPIIDAVMGWAEFLCTPKGGFGASANLGTWFYKAAAVAELGFIVVAIDGRGMPGRDKKFRTEGYGWIPSNNKTEDRIAGIKQLGQRYPELDLDKVGIIGWNGSVTPLYSMLEHADFYRAGVSQCLQDTRFMANIYGEHYEGLTPSDRKQAEDMAENLAGKLLMIHGMSDVCDPPVATLRMAHAFQKANRDFDMLLLPTEGGYHHVGSGYAIRRAWDYFTVHLGGEVPPENFRLVTGQDEMFGFTGDEQNVS